MADRHTIRVAVIGAGPRGISVLERISANQEVTAGVPVQVVLYDPHPPGGGRVWAGEQPAHLLMNTLCADATHFTDDTVRCEGPIVPGPNLFEWATQLADQWLPAQDDELRAELPSLQPWSHPSRKLLGRYLEWCYEQDLAHLPEGVSVQFSQQLVTGVRPGGGGYDVLTEGGTAHFDAVVLATGHSDVRPSPREVDLRAHAEAHGLFHGLPSNPISVDLSRIRPGQRLVVRGLGMNFFDYMSLLTVGRGGRYLEADDGTLTYEPSGQEPVLVAGSRRGVPYRAKGAFGTMTPTFERRYLTDEHLASLEVADRQLDFMTDLWPHIAKDTALTYYTVLARTQPEAFAAPLEELVQALDAHAWADPRLHETLAALVPEAALRLDLEDLDRPLRDRSFTDYEEFFTWWRNDLAHDYAESQRGYDSPLKCASIALGAGRAPIRYLARYGGFTGYSYAHDVEGWFRGYGGALASGPPAQRIRELIALVDAGIVLPLGPDMQVEARDGSFIASSPAIPGFEHECAGLLEAHLPAANASHSTNPLLRQLVDEGRARPYAIPNPESADFISGALEVGREPYALVDRDGHEQPGIFVVGVPLESIHWGTQLGPLAGTNSRFLRDNDAVARAALRHARARHEGVERVFADAGDA